MIRRNYLDVAKNQKKKTCGWTSKEGGSKPDVTWRGVLCQEKEWRTPDASDRKGKSSEHHGGCSVSTMEARLGPKKISGGLKKSDFYKTWARDRERKPKHIQRKSKTRKDGSGKEVLRLLKKHVPETEKENDVSPAEVGRGERGKVGTKG